MSQLIHSTIHNFLACTNLLMSLKVVSMAGCSVSVELEHFLYALLQSCPFWPSRAARMYLKNRRISTLSDVGLRNSFNSLRRRRKNSIVSKIQLYCISESVCLLSLTKMILRFYVSTFWSGHTIASNIFSKFHCFRDALINWMADNGYAVCTLITQYVDVKLIRIGHFEMGKVRSAFNMLNTWWISNNRIVFKTFNLRNY